MKLKKLFCIAGYLIAIISLLLLLIGIDAIFTHPPIKPQSFSLSIIFLITFVVGVITVRNNSVRRQPKGDKKVGPMILWKVYLVIMCLLYLAEILDTIKKPSIILLLDLYASTFSIIALYGYCFKIKIMFQEFWKIAFFTCVIAEAAIGCNYIIMLKLNLIIVIFGVILVFPIYYAFYKYALKGNDPWKSNNNNAIDNYKS